jgi:hypothetical protein
MGVVADSQTMAASATPAANATADSSAKTTVTPSADRRRARYDCAACHY